MENVFSLAQPLPEVKNSFFLNSGHNGSIFDRVPQFQRGNPLNLGRLLPERGGRIAKLANIEAMRWLRIPVGIRPGAYAIFALARRALAQRDQWFLRVAPSSSNRALPAWTRSSTGRAFGS
jgi:hypothetical protein